MGRFQKHAQQAEKYSRFAAGEEPTTARERMMGKSLSNKIEQVRSLNQRSKGSRLTDYAISKMNNQQAGGFTEGSLLAKTDDKEEIVSPGSQFPAPNVKGFVKGVGKGVSKASEFFDPALEAITGREPASTEQIFGEVEEGEGLGAAIGELTGLIPTLVAGGAGAAGARAAIMKLAPKLATSSGFVGTLGKALTGATEGVGAVTAFSASQLEAPTAGELTGGAALGALIEPVAPLIGKAVKHFKTPKGVRQIEKAGKEVSKAIKPRLTIKRDLNTIKKNYDIANKEIVSRGFLPSDVASYNKAIKSTKRSIWKDIEARLKQGTDAELELHFDDISRKIRGIANDKALLRSNRAAAKQVEAFADDIVSQGNRVPVMEAEKTKQFLNAELEGLFGEINLSKPLKEAKKLATREIGKQLDTILSKGKSGEFQALKNKYGALSSIEEDVLKRMIVFERQNPQGLSESISRIAGLGNITKGIMKLSPSDVGKGFTELAAGQLAKRANDADLLIKKAFTRFGKFIPKNFSKEGAIRGITQAELKSVFAKRKHPKVDTDDFIKKNFKDDADLSDALVNVERAFGEPSVDFDEFVQKWQVLKETQKNAIEAFTELEKEGQQIAKSLKKFQGVKGKTLTGKSNDFRELLDTSDPTSIMQKIDKKIGLLQSSNKPIPPSLQELRGIFSKIENGQGVSDKSFDPNDLFEAIKSAF